MAGMPKEHGKLYFDALCRTQKLETVLSLIHATYQAKKSEVSDIKTEIAKRLENAYNLFKTNIRGTDSGSGSYSGTMKQFESQYTIGHELCIWSNSNLDLTSFASDVAKGNMTIREYFDIFFLSYFQPIDNKGVQVLYLILKYMVQESKNEINKELIPFALGVEAEREDINALCNFLSDTSYINYDGEKIVYIGKEAIETFITRCNTRYLGEEGLIKARTELNTDEKYISYVMSGKLQTNETEEEINYSLTVKDLGQTLSKMYNSGSKVVAIHLFGIRYGKYIRKMHYNVNDIIEASGIKDSYSVELNKGILLSNYVKEVFEINSEESIDFDPEHLEKDYDKFKKLLGWFVKQLNINNNIIEGNKTSGQGYKGGSIREQYKEWREFGAFTLDCNIVGGFQSAYSKVNYINKTDTGINIRPSFDKTTKKIKYFFIDIFEISESFTEEVLDILNKEYTITSLELFDDLEPNDSIKDFFKDYMYVEKSLSVKKIDYEKHKPLKGGENIILYGVPGSGKSHTIKEEYLSENSYMLRVVFHPDYTYSDFIGQILPKTVDEKIKYNFEPGPFTKILEESFLNLSKKHYLIIEEINRGNAPAIFGDIFQLLDRDSNGRSEYEITNSDISRIVFKNEETKIYIPSNMSIIGTMNTSDQNVFTLDTAFQRRWKMRLIKNKFKDTPEENEFANTKILDTNVTWNKFLTEINHIILFKNIRMTSSEDKRLGTHFINIEDLKYTSGDSVHNSRFSEKVLKYLWDDAFKFTKEDIFDLEKVKSLEEVIELFAESNNNDRFKVFKENIYNILISQVNNNS